jgi:hypothetical protein
MQVLDNLENENRVWHEAEQAIKVSRAATRQMVEII